MSRLAAAALALGSAAQAGQRLQEGAASHHFDGNFPPPSAQVELALETLTGRCLATADVFSGRRNPVWRLSARSLADLRARISRGNEPDADAQPIPGLGYRGVVIACQHRAGPRRVRVFCGEASWADSGAPIASVPGLDRDLLVASADRTARSLARGQRGRCFGARPG